MGAWLWQSGWFTQTRELHWQVSGDRSSIREIEIQIWGERGELLKREVFFFPQGSVPEIVQRVPLAKGDYLARVFVKRAVPPESEQYAQTLRVNASTLVLPLRSPDPPH